MLRRQRLFSFGSSVVTANLFFESSAESIRPEQGPGSPLAERMRPRSFEDVVGQDHLLGERGPLARARERQEWDSMIFWGLL